MRKICILFIVISALLHAQAQNIVFGLKDKRGDLWFTVTDRGVYRFDGKSFSRFTGYVGSSFITQCIYEDKKGNLWFKTNDGDLCKYNGKEFMPLDLPLPSENNLDAEKYRSLLATPVEVTKMADDKNGNFWFLTATHGVYRSDSLGTKKSFTQYYPGDAWPVWPVCILETSKGDILVGSWDQSGLHRFNGNNFESLGGFSDGMIFSIAEDRVGNIWVGTRVGGVDKWDGTMGADGRAVIKNFSKLNGFEQNVPCSLHDSKGNMWFGTNWNNLGVRGDLFLYDGVTFRNMTAQEKSIKFSDFAVRSLIEDDHGNVWVGSKNGILLRYDGKNFTDFSNEISR